MLHKEKDLRKLKTREEEIRKAIADFPGLDINEAYTRWKKARHEAPVFLSSADQAARNEYLTRYASMPCTQTGCTGTMILEPICPACVEGKAGYNSKHTCNVCFFRILSKKDYSDWLPNDIVKQARTK